MQSIVFWPTLVVLLVATATDIRSRRIPNWLVFPFLLAGVVVSGISHGWRGIAVSISGIALATVVTGLLWWLRGMGMGDVKLCAAVGAWIGPEQLITALVVMAITGGVMALIWAACSGAVRESLDGASDLIFGLWKRGLRPHQKLVLDNPLARKMPYAPAIAIGTLFSFFSV
jgi:prepilin peptidase CpaA